MFAIKVVTKYHVNGHPRTGWLIFDKPGSCINFVEEGYDGERALRLTHPAFGPVDSSGTPGPAIVTCVLEITGAEWQRLRKAQRTRKAWGLETEEN